MSRSALGRAVETALAAGLLLSAGLLAVGLALASPGLLRLGILLLMLTPVARVVVVTLGLLRRREYFFGLLSLGILGVLCFSMVVGTGLL